MGIPFRSSRTAVAVLAGAGWMLAGCSSSDQIQVTSGQVRPPTAVGGNTLGSGSGSSSGTGSTGGSSGATGGSGSTTGGGCTTVANLNQCSSDMVELAGKLISFCGGGAPITESIQVQDLNDPTVMAETDTCGDFYFCVPAGTVVTADIQASNFIPTIAPPIEALANSLQPAITLFCNSLIGTLATEGVDLDVSKAAIGVNVFPYFQSPTCPDAGAGWSFELNALDGGSIAAQTVIVAGTNIDPLDMETGPNGSALLINIDSTWQNAILTAYFDGGATGCENGFALPPFYQTGILPLRAGQVSYELFQPRDEGNRSCALSTGTTAPFDRCTSPSDCEPGTVCEGDTNGYFCRPLCLSQTDCIPWLGTFPNLVCQPQNCADGTPSSAQLCTDHSIDTLLPAYTGSSCCSG